MAEITHKGQRSTSTLGGEIRIEEGRGRLVIYDALTQREINVVDRTGYTFSDDDERRIKIGNAPDDGRIGQWITKDGKDVIQELGG